MYKISLIFVVITTITACTGMQSNNSNSASGSQVQENKNFIITNFTKADFTPSPHWNDCVLFTTAFEIKNNTENKFTSFNLYASIIVKDADGFVWKASYCSGEYVSSPLVNDKNLWLPNTSLKYSFTIPDENPNKYPGSGDCHISNIKVNYFKRTPVSVVLSLKYEAISVDGEYNETMDYNILDQWMAYQRKLGLR